MNKGSGTIIAIIVVCIVAAIVIYFFARTNSKPENEEHLQNNESEYIFDINADGTIEGEEGVEYKNGTHISTEELKNIDVVKTSVSDTELQKNNNESPTTGPGSVAMAIAVVVAAISAVVIYKKQGGESAF